MLAIVQAKWLKVVPHLVDTVLLTSAITLAVKLSANPADTPWILAKIIALLLYIVAGSFALKRGKSQQIKIISGVIALLLFAYIIMVAVTKNVLGFLG